MAEEHEKSVADAWRGSAPYWEKHGERVREMFAPLTRGLLEAADVAAGHRVLDVAGGPGEPSRTIAREVGPGGLVVHTDVAEGMSAAARRARVDPMRFAVASGDALPFADGAFDRVVCRLGVMFFPDAGRGLAEMVRVARAGGRIALVVWGLKERNPFFAIPSEAAGRYIPSPPDPPGAPNAWRFGEPGLLAEMLAEARASEVGERRLAFEIAAPLDFDAFWRMRVELSDTLRDKTAVLTNDERDRLREEVRDETRDYFATGTMRFPAEAVVVWGVSRG
jgi:SAM-dependent methyltransferase